jgi:DNA-binding XRE family transcriptional regulator
MDLRDYFFHNKKKQTEMANALNITSASIASYKAKKYTPSLYTATLIVDYTEGAVQYRDLLSEKDLEKIEKTKNPQSRGNK